MTAQFWLARDADGEANFYSLLTAPPVRQADGLVTTQDETGECLAVFSAEQAESLFGVRLQPGEFLSGQFRVQVDDPARTIPDHDVSRGRRHRETIASGFGEGRR